MRDHALVVLLMTPRPIRSAIVRADHDAGGAEAENNSINSGNWPSEGDSVQFPELIEYREALSREAEPG